MALYEKLVRLQLIAKEAREKLEASRKKVEQTFSINGDKRRDEAVEYANSEVKRAAAVLFVRKYAQAGVITKSGRLLKAISNPSVKLLSPLSGAKKTKVSIAFPAGLPGKKDTKKASEKSVYLYGSAVNFGSVRQPKQTRPFLDPINATTTYKKMPLVGRKLAKSLKRKAFGAKPKRRVEQYIERNKRLTKKGVSQFAIQMVNKRYRDRTKIRHVTPGGLTRLTKGYRKTVTYDIKSAGISITRPFDFFSLNQQEQATLAGIWLAAFNRKYYANSQSALSA